MFLAFIATVWAYGGDPLVQIDEIECYGAGVVVELRLREVRASVAGGLIMFNTRAYHYVNADGDLIPSVPGPTIKMKAGHQCQLVLINELTARDGEDCRHVYNEDGTHKDGFFCSDTTNIHTHGLWVSANEDDISSYALPGGNWTYTYNIQPEHMPGSFWYHAHHHGSTTLHVYGGQFGALLLEPEVDWNTYFHYDVDLTTLYEEAQVLVMFQAWFGGDDDVNEYTSYTNGFWMADYIGVANNYTTVTIDPNVTFQDEYLKDFYVVNNQYQPVVQLRANSAVLLRIIHASGARVLNLIVDPDEDTNASCEMKLIARDGIFQYTPYSSIDTVYLLQGTRADVAFICPPGTYNVRTEPSLAYCPLTGLLNNYIQEKVFTIESSEFVESKENTAFPTTEVIFPWYLANSCESSKKQPHGYYSTTIFGFPHTGHGYAMQGAFAGKTYKGYEFQDHRDEVKYLPWDDDSNPWAERYCMNQIYDIKFISAENFTDRCFEPFTPEDIQNAIDLNKTCLTGFDGQAGYHPYHQHVMPFQVVRYDKGYDQGYEQYGDEIARLCEWRDTIPGVHHFTLRLVPRLFTGDVVAHCHITQHEDRGMMGFLDFTDEDDFCFAQHPMYDDGISDPAMMSAWGTESNSWFIFALILIIILAFIIFAVVCFFCCAKDGCKGSFQGSANTTMTKTVSMAGKKMTQYEL